MESVTDIFERILSFLKKVSLRQATLIALILASISLLIDVGFLIGVIGYYGFLPRLIVVLNQASLALFFAVLFLKQKGD